MPDPNYIKHKEKRLNDHYKQKASEISSQEEAEKKEAREVRKENRDRIAIFISVCSLFISFFTLLLSLHLHDLL